MFLNGVEDKDFKMMINKSIKDMLLLIDEVSFVDGISQNKNISYFNNRIKVTLRPSLNNIIEAESNFKCKLPQSYISFNLESVWWAFNCTCNLITEPFKVNNSDNVFLPNIVEINEYVRSNEFYENEIYFKSKIPNYLIVYDSSNSGDDDYYCFDTRYPDEKGEYPIVYWSPASSDNQEISINNRYQLVSPNFSTYMHSKITTMESETLKEFKKLEFTKVHSLLSSIKESKS